MKNTACLRRGTENRHPSNDRETEDSISTWGEGKRQYDVPVKMACALDSFGNPGNV